MRKDIFKMKKIFISLSFVLLLIGCSWLKNDKSFITEQMFEKADKVYQETKSLDSVRASLEKAQWTPSEINQAIYRIKKVNHLEEKK